MYVCMYVCMHVCTYVCMYVCMHVLAEDDLHMSHLSRVVEILRWVFIECSGYHYVS